MASSGVIPQSTAMSPAEAGDGADEVVQATALLFRVFARAFGAKWRATFEDRAAPAVWERKFRLAGLSAAAIRAGIGPATDLDFPPSLGEFVALCRPSAPLLDDALRESVAWVPDIERAWSHPAVGATARQVGHWRLHSLDDRRLRPLFASIYSQMLDRFAKGEALDLPVVRALPAEVRTVTPRGAEPPDSVRSAIAEAARALGVSHD